MQRPNLIFIVADDLGYADLGCYGGRPASFGAVSPHIDAMAARGIRFTQGYANSPVCSPTRFALMTARWQYRLRGAAEEPIASRHRGHPTLGLPPSHPTLPSLLREAGYRTALVGKWHLGWPPHFGPQLSGYDESYGPYAGGVDYFTHHDSAGQHDMWRNGEQHHEDGYLTDLFTRHAVDFVRRMAGSGRGTSGSLNAAPFFLSLHYTAPHWPWETRADRELAQSPEVRQSLFHLSGGNVDTYRRMIHHMDEGIGELMAALEETGAAENTLVVFTSDNGGERFSDNWPLVGGKMDLTEGGIRVPWVAQWPAVISAGRVSAQHCLTMDWSATMLAAGGAAPHPEHPLDGVDLSPVLSGRVERFERPMAWRMNHRSQRAYRLGRWKYLRVDGHDYLFDIETDERERANRAALEPARLAELRAAYEAWEAAMPPIPAEAGISLGYGAKDMPQR